MGSSLKFYLRHLYLYLRVFYILRLIFFGCFLTNSFRPGSIFAIGGIIKQSFTVDSSAMTLPSFLAVHILIASLHEVLGKKKRRNEDKKKRKIGKKKRGDTL